MISKGVRSSHITTLLFDKSLCVDNRIRCNVLPILLMVVCWNTLIAVRTVQSIRKVGMGQIFELSLAALFSVGVPHWETMSQPRPTWL